MSRTDRHRPWDPGGQKPRVLLECPDSSSPSVVSDVIERHGFDVRVCEGPAERGGCELIDHGTCALVSGADVVVNMLDAADPQAVEVLAAVTSERRPPGVVVELTDPRQRHDDVVQLEPARRRATVLTTPVRSRDLVRGIRSALARRHLRVPWWGDGAP